MATQPAPAQTAPATPAKQQLDPASVRQVVQAQTTVLGSVAALLQGVAGVIHQALTTANPAELAAFAASLEGDMAAWASAVLANTPSAQLTAEPFVNVPGYLQDVFTNFAVDQQKAQTAKAEQGAQSAHR